MKHGQIVIGLAVLSFLAAVLVSTPPSAREITQINTPVPSPSPTPRPVLGNKEARLVFVGDIMLSRSVGDLMAAKQDWFWPFRAIASSTAGADLAFANLESVISDRGTLQGCGFCFRADPRAAVGLASAGFDVLSVANNHAWDYGPDAFSDTARHLAAHGMAAVGSGPEPVIRDVQGTSVAFLAYTDLLPRSACESVNCYEPTRMASDIAAARGKADVVVVSFHTGEEYMPANAHQQAIYRAAVDAGADLVVGHHPHVVQEMEQYGKGWIAYSLGNFIFDQTFSEPTTTGTMLEVAVRDGRVTTVTPRTIGISKQYQPSLVVEP